MYKVHNPHENVHYSEENQDLLVQFAFATPTIPNTWITLHNFVKCRDFLSDAIFWKTNGTLNKKVYGFSISKQNYTLLKNYIAVKARPEYIDSICQNCNAEFNGQFVTERTEDPSIALVTLHSIGVMNPVTISFFSLLIKLYAVVDFGAIRKGKDLEDHPKIPAKEKGYLSKIGYDFFLVLLAQPQLHTVHNRLNFKDEKVLTYDDSTIHEYLGIVSMFNAHSPDSNLKTHYQTLKQQYENDKKNKNKNPNLRTDTTTTQLVDLIKAAIDPNWLNAQFDAIPEEDVPQQQAAPQEQVFFVEEAVEVANEEEEE